MDPARSKGSRTLNDPRLPAIPDVHGHAKGEHKPFAEERPIAYSPRMLFLWFYHACRRGSPRFMMVSDHINYLTFEDPGAVHTVRRALKLAEAGDLYGAAETAGVDVAHAAVVSQGLRRGMRFSIGAELDNDPRARPDAQNIVDAMRPDGMIRAVHFLTIEHPEKGPDYQWAFDNPEFRELYDVVGTERVWELYIAKLIDDIEKLPGNIVAHFYVPAQFGHWPDDKKLESYEDRLIDACAARGMAIEVNTRFLYRENDPQDQMRYRSALLRLLKKAKAKSVGIAVSSDAHSPKDQGSGFAEVLRMLDEAEINELVFPVNGRLARVALRATKEHLQKVKAQEPQPQPGSSISGFSRAELGLPERNEAEEREAALAAAPKRGRAAKEKAAAAAKAKAEEKSQAKAAAKASAKAVKEAAAKAVKEAKAAAKTVQLAAKKAAKAEAVKKAEPVKKAQPAKKADPVKKAAPAKKALAVKKAVPVKKTPVKKAAAPKQAAAKKAPAKKTAPAPAKKSAPAKKAPAKKASAPKHAPAKKAPAKKAPAAKKPAHKVSPAKRTATKKTSKRR